MKKFSLTVGSLSEMLDKLASLKEYLASLKFSSYMSKMEKPLEIRHVRRQIARLQTVINAMKRGEVPYVKDDKENEQNNNNKQ